METRANYVLIGAFTLLTAAFLLLFGLWAAKYTSDKDWRYFNVIFDEAVTGLTEGGSVQYNGISVGTVDTLSLAPDDPRKVIAKVKLRASTPVKVDTHAKLSFTGLTGTATFRGNPVERDITGFGDPAFRLSMNFIGAPALSLADFRSYEQDLIIGGSIQVSVPVGQYDETKLLNIGTHRWYLKPELGVSKALGDWTLEGKAAVTLFSTNDDFFNGNRRAQEPLYSFQAHVIYNFARGVWGSVDATC